MPITIDGSQVNNSFQRGDLQAGNTITITDIQLEPGRASIVNDNELYISSFFADIRVVSQATGSTPFTPPRTTPQFFPEVQQKNQDWNQEENDLVILAAELLSLINQNTKIVQQSQSLELNLPEFPSNTLDYFQEEFFSLLDEAQPLDSPQNKQINANNQKIKQKKQNIKQNINRIYNDNEKKLAEAKTGQTPPKNELEKLKKEIREQINKVLTDKDNLRNIDLITLANGKYQNWEKDIELINNPNEVMTYGNAFLSILKETGTKEKKQEIENKKNFHPIVPQNSPEKNIVDDSFKKTITNLPLAAAKTIARNKIRELFKKYQPDIEKIKEVWQGTENWMSYLEKCGSQEEVIQFLKKLEKSILQQVQKPQNQEENGNPKNPTSTNSWIWISVSLIIIGLIFVLIIASVLISPQHKVIKRGKSKV